MEWGRLGSESITGRQGYSSGYKKDIFIEMLDPTGVVVEKWKLEGSMVTNANFGDLDFSDDSLSEITIDVRFDRAILLF